MITNIVIPAYNEQHNVKHIHDMFEPHTDQVHVYYVVDGGTTDDTFRRAAFAFADMSWWHPRQSPFHGKGQTLSYAMRILGTTVPEVVFCDADVHLTPGTVRRMLLPLQPHYGQRILVPQRPSDAEWDAAEQQAGMHFQRDMLTWARMSGCRRVRTNLIPGDLYGYLTETQINKNVSAHKLKTEYVETRMRSPLRFTAERVRDLKEHGEYGVRNGILLY